jgi:DNA replication factor GINS
MSETNELDVNKLHHLVSRETENDSIQEINPDFYRNLSDFIGNLKKQEFDGVENKIKEAIINTATELTSLLIKIRLDKISKSTNIDFRNLLDEEKFIFDAG